MGQPTRKGYLSSVSNNPRSNWYEYLGCAASSGTSCAVLLLTRANPMVRRLPEDIDEWTIEDLRGLVVAPTPATPADPAESKLQITLADFQGYLDCVGNPYRYLAANRPVPQGVSANGTNGDASSSSAPQDAASLAGVPEICFRSDFDLAQPETFGFFSPPDQPHATMVMLERLTQWLDQVRRRSRAAPARRRRAVRPPDPAPGARPRLRWS